MPNLNLPAVGDKNVTGWAQKLVSAIEVVNEGLEDATGAVPLSMFYDAKNPPATYDAAFAAAIATGREILVERPGDYPVSLGSVVDKSVIIRSVSGATLVQRDGLSIGTITATPTGPWPAVSVNAEVEWRNLARSEDDIPIEETVRTITLGNPADLARFKRGDKLFIDSDETYLGQYVTSSTGAKTFKAGWLGATGIRGITVKVNTPGIIPVRSVITGATSGASGIVSSVAIDNGGSIWIMLDRVSAPFTSDETLTIAGAAVGTAASSGGIVPASLLDDTDYGGNLLLWKGNENVVVDIDIAVRAASDPEVVGQAERKVALTLEGIINARVNLHMHNGYKAALVLMSCLGGTFTGTGGNLSNIPQYDAFGYFLMLRGFTEHIYADLRVHNVRHVVTTNAAVQATHPTNSLILLRTSGTQKHNTITGVGRECTAAAWDTHAGGWMNHFKSVTAIYTRPTGKDDAQPVGVQNRSFGTIVTDPVVIGCETAYLDHTYRFAAEKENTVHYVRPVAIDYLRLGFFQGTSTKVATTSRGKTRYLLDRPSMSARRGAKKSISYSLGMAETTIIEPLSRGAQHADFQVRPNESGDGIPQLTIFRPTVDVQANPDAAVGSGYVFDLLASAESSRRIVITGLDLLDNITGAARRSIFNIAAGVTARIRRPAVARGLFQMIRPTGTGPVLKTGDGTLDSADIATL